MLAQALDTATIVDFLTAIPHTDPRLAGIVRNEQVRLCQVEYLGIFNNT